MPRDLDGANRAKLNRLRDRMRAADEALRDHESAMRSKYGGDYKPHWLRAPERSKLERL